MKPKHDLGHLIKSHKKHSGVPGSSAKIREYVNMSLQNKNKEKEVK